MSRLTRSDEWRALEAQAEIMKNAHLRDLFRDAKRLETLSIDNRELGMLLDYSKNLVSGGTLELLRDLAAAAGVRERAAAMFSGEKINWTEGRVALLGDAAHPLLQELVRHDMLDKQTMLRRLRQTDLQKSVRTSVRTRIKSLFVV